MKYHVVSVEQLMEYEYTKVEGNWTKIPQSELNSLLPKGVSHSTFIEDIAKGEHLLLTDVPDTPLIIHSKNATDKHEWQINPVAEKVFHSTLIKKLKQRINSVTKQGSPSQKKTDSLTPAIEPHYIHPIITLSENTEYVSQGPIAYEYNFEIAFSKHTPNRPLNFDILLAKKDSKETESDWQGRSTKYGTRYTLKSNSNVPRKLKFQVANGTMGLSLESVKMVGLGAGTVKEAFIPIMPAIQFGERLGLATAGYLYHFQGDRLIQEYKWLGEQGFSPLSTSQSEHAFNHVSKALLIYWKIAGKIVKDQYLVHRRKRLSSEEKSVISINLLKKIGVHLDVEAILSVSDTSILERDASEESNITKTEAIRHTIQTNPATGHRETLAEIAEQYGTTAYELIKLNPDYEFDLDALKVGSVLLIEQAQSNNTNDTDHFEYPPEAPDAYNNPFNSYYQSNQATIPLSSSFSLLALKQHYVKLGLPIVNVKPEGVLRIGLFFDGTGQNAKNDEYKENNGDKSRSNIARLFNAYPEKNGHSSKIYISGTGTLDNAWQNPTLIDEGEDETPWSGATGLYDKNSAYAKWRSLLEQFAAIVDDLRASGKYNAITHISFDLFGFSRGAALARHFVNALKMGLPDYTQSRGKDTSAVSPNLLAPIDSRTLYTKDYGYAIDTTRTSSVRFLGLFDTVGSFYEPGDNDNGEFQLTVQPQDIGRAFQIVAHHEYRTNFPLSSLKTQGSLPNNFYEEVFPGAHSDVGGGYPFVKQYQSKELPERYGSPTQSTYNRELVKVINTKGLNEHGLQYTPADLAEIWAEWPETCMTEYGQAGLTTIHRGKIYFYRLQPIDASLSGLSQERMKQQASAFGIDWNADAYELPKDYEENSPAKEGLWPALEALPLGHIQPEDWQDLLYDHCIHRPHDTEINPGCSSITSALINSISNAKEFTRYQPDAPLKAPNRQIYDND